LQRFAEKCSQENRAEKKREKLKNTKKMVGVVYFWFVADSTPHAHVCSSQHFCYLLHAHLLIDFVRQFGPVLGDGCMLWWSQRQTMTNNNNSHEHKNHVNVKLKSLIFTMAQNSTNPTN
jgi:hypothetical protein